MAAFAWIMAQLPYLHHAGRHQPQPVAVLKLIVIIHMQAAASVPRNESPCHIGTKSLDVLMNDNHSPKPHERGDSFGLKLFLAVLAVTVAVFAWTSSHYHQHNQERDTWVDKSGKLHVLGITLGASSLRQAEIALQSRSDVALYIYPLEHPKAGMKLEAYFPAIADNTQVILLLDASPELLQQMQARATMPHIYPNTVARSDLAPADQQLVQQMLIRELTLLPSIAITQQELTSRFGAPTNVHHADSGKTVYAFPAIGLEATLVPDEPAQLHFTNPVAASTQM